MSRVLIVEDTAIARQSLAKILKYEGHEAQCAANGIEALAALEKSHPLPDVVLLDLMMPKMDGVKFLETLRADQRFRALPVIVMTGSMDSSSLTRIRALGVEALLTKASFDLEDLLMRLHERAA
ncbi:MAG: response regulator [Chthoniobacterales bacterium]|nr:response regulator [Chthoniobacterales bacterium]